MSKAILVALLGSMIPLAAHTQTIEQAGYCYANSGLSWRACDQGAPPQPGEIWFADLATPDQLTAAFPGYAGSQAAQAAANAQAAALAAGVAVSSTATPALDGVYAIDAATQAKVQAVALYIQVNGRFPAGVSALPWPDAGGTPHTFPTTAAFQAFATALGDYVTALSLGQSPAQPVAIP